MLLPDTHQPRRAGIGWFKVHKWRLKHTRFHYFIILEHQSILPTHRDLVYCATDSLTTHFDPGTLFVTNGQTIQFTAVQVDVQICTLFDVLEDLVGIPVLMRCGSRVVPGMCIPGYRVDSEIKGCV